MEISRLDQKFLVMKENFGMKVEKFDKKIKDYVVSLRKYDEKIRK